MKARRVETVFGMTIFGVDGSAPLSSPSSPSALSVSSSTTSPLVKTIDTGSIPQHVSFTASTSLATSSSSHSDPFISVISGIGCRPTPQISPHASVNDGLFCICSRYISTLDISFPAKNGRRTPSTPSTVDSCSRHEVNVALPSSFHEYTIGTGPGKFPLASSCSFAMGNSASTVPSTNTALALARVRITELNLVTSLARSSNAVGSEGSGSTSSGWRVIFLEGDLNASERRERAVCARDDSVMERASASWRRRRRDTLMLLERCILVLTCVVYLYSL
mmetsp:Transcript_22441/g.48816  ORF Transcript_22441/g.48816 Transcript_22441/m.48816 type:complete len:278 (+) Transcript_22441:399-1232(+)